MPRVAYLINQYPKTSHSFIRREIHALEALGIEVDRYSIRNTEGGHVDPMDQEEAKKTTVLLADPSKLSVAVMRNAASSPTRFATAARLAYDYAKRSDRGYVNHAAYLAEACLAKNEMLARQTSHLHAHFGTNSGIVARLVHALGGPEYSFTVHGPEEFDRAAVLDLGATIREAKFVAAISEYGRSQLCRQVPRKSWHKIVVVRCGLQGEMLSRDQSPIPEQPRLVCVGRLHEQKGQFVLLEALAELKRRGVACELVLAGDGPMRGELEARITELGLNSQVRITGWITEQQVIQEISAARAFVLPSFAEGLPVVIMEAMALGRPVISTYVAGIPELVKPGENGWLVPAGAVEPLVEAMTDALSASPQKLAEMGRRGQAAVRAQHDVGNSARRLVKLMAGAFS